MKPFRRILFAVMLVALTACKSTLFTDLTATSGEKLFWDDFSDSSGNWPQFSGSNGSLEVADGTYRIQVLTAQNEILATPGHAFRDVQVEADATRLGGPLQNLFGLACRSSDSENFYFFAISSDGYYGLGKVKNSRAALLGQAMLAYSPAIVQGAGPNHLRFDCIGQSLKGSVNDQVLAISTDPDFSTGDVGLLAGALDTPGVEVGFDNFVVYKP